MALEPLKNKAWIRDLVAEIGAAGRAAQVARRMKQSCENAGGIDRSVAGARSAALSFCAYPLIELLGGLASWRLICFRGRPPNSIDETLALLAGGDYIAERSLATALFLALKMERPLFLEGEAGVGKTEVAKVVARALGRRLVRLQCYEGLDIASAV